MAEEFESNASIVEANIGGIYCGHSNGRWWLRVVLLGDLQGATKTKTFNGETLKEVFAKLDESKKANFGDCAFIGPPPTDFDDWRQFLNSDKKNGAVILSQRHYIREMGTLKTHLEDDSPFLKEALGDFLKEFL